MSFDDEWSRIRAGQAGVRLNQLDGGGGGGTQTPDLKSSPEAKKAAADAIQQVLDPDTRTAGDHADTATAAARAAFGGWQTASALQTVEETWNGQVKMLLGRLAGEQTALRGSGLSFRSQDLKTRDAYRSLIGEQGEN
ncbi:hypothetical protein [Streptomyces bambusae]|uniref:Uncharacterized protein n=1 Tax=Streptomyces bambusae TaxID=1550616 RepID=A0ABS6ZDZ1_9ACTN|nr:hypothetical protein [Streptomyces bambusae]MBW5485806.1 hypothetical protein [Streptomyces bambusae]